MAREFKTTKRVEFAETDCAGILHFASFFRYMEEVEHEFLRSCGLSVHTTLEDGSVIGFPRVSARCDFSNPVTFEDVLDVHLWISRLGTKTIEYSFLFSMGNKEIAMGQVIVIACKVGEGHTIQSIPIPEPFKKVLKKADLPPLSFHAPSGEKKDG